MFFPIKYGSASGFWGTCPFFSGHLLGMVNFLRLFVIPSASAQAPCHQVDSGHARLFIPQRLLPTWSNSQGLDLRLSTGPSPIISNMVWQD